MTNTIMITGNLVRDPYFSTGEKTEFLAFTVADSKQYFNQNLNDWTNVYTNFLNCNAFGATAVAGNALGLRKGDNVTVVGELRPSDNVYEKDGKRYEEKYKIMITAVQLNRHSRKSDDVPEDKPRKDENKNTTPHVTVEKNANWEDEDVPF